ncbi:hypothetical protein DFH06DRAFT_223468 [Mycena polygramma]|nr:hypothetical protein DFH06DRAFT_223468 [Mycena polygramma]
MSLPIPARSAQYPLTVFDNVFERATFLTGWLVQGTIDTNLLAAAIRRTTDKWRVFAGRLELIPESKSWQMNVPLDPLPEDYATFVLTECTSDVPLSTYVTIPVGTRSEALPQNLFLHPLTPRQNSEWIARRHPLTCWHVTYFPSRAAGEPAYSCIGFARSHGIFDGIGAALFMRALVAEMQGKEWDVPPPPPEGFHPNPLDQALRRNAVEGKTDYPQPGYSVLGVKGVIWLAGWHLRERFWRGAIHRIFTIPKECILFLVDGVKAEVRHDNPDLQVTTGDVLVAWIMKVIYKTGTPPSQVLGLSNFASFRDLISDVADKSLAQYPHNAFLPLPYPTLTVRELNSLTLPEFTLALCRSRLKLTVDHVISAYQFLTNNPITMPVHPDAQETLVISNVSASRILEADWSPIGSQSTVCSYRFSATPNKLVLGNTAYISGRLPDSSTIIDVNLNTVRMQNLTTAIEKLKLKVPAV